MLGKGENFLKAHFISKKKKKANLPTQFLNLMK